MSEAPARIAMSSAAVCGSKRAEKKRASESLRCFSGLLASEDTAAFEAMRTHSQPNVTSAK